MVHKNTIESRKKYIDLSISIHTSTKEENVLMKEGDDNSAADREMKNTELRDFSSSTEGSENIISSRPCEEWI